MTPLLIKWAEFSKGDYPVANIAASTISASSPLLPKRCIYINISFEVFLSSPLRDWTQKISGNV